MPLRAYKIEEISAVSTFELAYDSHLWSILEQIGALKGLGEGGGIIQIDENDLQEMEKLLHEDLSKDANSIQQMIAKIREDLDKEWKCVNYYCY